MNFATHVPWLALLAGAFALLWALRRTRSGERDWFLPFATILLVTFGEVMLVRLSPALARKQLIWISIAFGLSMLLQPWLAGFRRIATIKYTWIVLSLALVAATAIFGERVNGAKLWIRIGSLHIEPVEIIKLLLVFFLAAYLAEMGDAIAKARAWSLRSNVKYLGPLFLGWGASIALLVVQRDLGMGALLLCTLLTTLYAATRRIDLAVGAATVFGLVAFWASTHFPYVHERIAVWLHPFADPYGAGYQATQSYFSIAAGGLLGTGLGLGHPGFIPDVSTDYIVAAVAEELGLLGVIALLALYLALVRRAVSIAREQPDAFASLLAIGLAATLGFQVVIIVAGVAGVVPLTGITLPFVSYGGSSLVANVLLISLLQEVGTRHAPVHDP
ncbi:MAG TPA: FtsW/RodA/SpoVE family cell cycle protein [Candidatus Dormibacteraeota bacterium]|nr:FtsW/RodA/SpoVE family cell cycle protein [Candidatus Dormibacteraeota bacterium]